MTEPTQAASGTLAPDPARPRILVVDDEAALRTALCATLADQEYDPEGAESGDRALALLHERRFELLLTDLMMPAMDGITLLRRALAADPDLVAIVITGEGTITSAVDAMKAGALDYIQKPFKLNVILPVLSRALTLRRLRMENVALQRRVHERTTELEATNQELEAFAHSVSHDLRAPLRAIDGFTSIVLDEHAAALPADAQRLLQSVHQGAKRMDRMIQDLLRFARVGRQSLVKQRVDMIALVQEVLAELGVDGIRVDTRVGALPPCSADPPLLKHVVTNLLSNALKYTRHRERPVVEVEGVARGGEVVYSVRDNGAGFDPKQASGLFGVFQRLHSDDQFEGTGVGLSIVRRIVHRHGGRVWADAALDQGAIFSFNLPDAPT